MKLQKYLNANLIALIGNTGLFIFLLSSFGNNSIQSLAWNYIEENCGIWAIVIAFLILLLIVEKFLNFILKNKYFLNIQIKNNTIKNVYNITFWLGFICSILYVILYFWFIYVLIN